MRLLLFVAIALCLPHVAGCGQPAKAPPVTVHGTVRVDGKLLDDGEILFKIPGEVPRIAPIKNGAYEITVDVGPKHIEILAYRQAKDFNMGGVIIKGSRENYLPDRYNIRTTLTADISPEGPKEFSFDVSTK